MVRRSRDDHQALLGEFLPPLHRTEGDKVMFRREQQNGRIEATQAAFRRTPVGNDIHTTPMDAWVPRGVGRQQGRWSWRRSTDMGRLKAGSVAAKIGQQGRHVLQQHGHRAGHVRKGQRARLRWATDSCKGLKGQDAPERLPVEVISGAPIAHRDPPVGHQCLDHRDKVLHGGGNRVLLNRRVRPVTAPTSQLIEEDHGSVQLLHQGKQIVARYAWSAMAHEQRQ